MEPKRDDGRVKVTFDALRRAPTMDNIFEMQAKGQLLASPNVSALFKNVLTPKNDFHRHVEQFNFGFLSHKAIWEAEKEAHQFIRHGCFTLPYPVCLFRCTIDFEDGEEPCGTTVLVVDGDGPGSEKPGHACVSFMSSATHMTAMHCINMMRWRDTEKDGVAVEVQVPKEEYSFWHDTIATTTRGGVNDIQKITLEDMCDAAKLVMGLVMILNTKGVMKDRTAPPVKPNKARARAGRPLLPWVTRVYTSAYNKAIAPGEGTHASPRPHRRRAHVRTYPATAHREAYSVPIAAMLVNWDGRPLERGEYEVHADA